MLWEGAIAMQSPPTNEHQLLNGRKFSFRAQIMAQITPKSVTVHWGEN